MKKIFLLCLLINLYYIKPCSAGWYYAGGADTTSPTLSTFVIDADGDTWTFTYDEIVTATDDGDMCDGYTVTMSTAGAITFTYASGTRGSDSVFTCTGSATVNSGETISTGLDYTQGTITDVATNALAAIDDKTTGFTNNSTQGGFTGLFYSDFEDESDDAQWTTTPTGWNDDYTGTVLSGTHSANLVTAGTAEVRSALAPVTGHENSTVYARMQFRVLNYGAGGSYAFGIFLESASDIIADCHFTTDTNTANVIYAEDSTGASTGTNPADKDVSDATYYFYLVYNDDTSVVCELRDSSFTLVSGWQDTNTTNAGEIMDKAGVYIYRQNQSIVIDNFEVREDTNWGN
jgi:hypothetical protein